MRWIIVPLIAVAVCSRAAATPTTNPALRDAEFDAILTKLMAQLGDDDPTVRDRAADQIKRIGWDARETLKRAAAGDDPEVAARAQALLDIVEGLPPEGRRHIYDWTGGFRENSTIFDTQIDNRSDYAIESVTISIRIVNRAAGTESWRRVVLRPAKGPIAPDSAGKLSGNVGVKLAENETYNWNIDVIRGQKTR